MVHIDRNTICNESVGITDQMIPPEHRFLPSSDCLAEGDNDDSVNLPPAKGRGVVYRVGQKVSCCIACMCYAPI